MTRLDPARCRILRDDALVARYNAVSEILENAARELPRFGEREVVAKARGALDKLAAKMARERFSIGFIGPSQAGKSTTVSNLLQVSKKDSPAPQGGGGPTTSIPTRLIPLASARGADASEREHSIALHYFSTAEFRERAKQLCEILDLKPDDDPGRLLEAVRALERDQPFIRVADRGVLERLLKARLAFPEVVTEPGRIEEGVFADRANYVTHGKDETKYTLLREVRITFVTDAISPEIEMIDLPGLGVDKESDARLTLEFVKQLDGAFLFQEARQQKPDAGTKLAEKMRLEHSRTLGERIWMVVTLCDALNDNQLNGPGQDKPSTFCHLAEMMQNQGVNAAHVIFVGNEYYQHRLAAGLGEEDPPTEALRTRYAEVLTFDAADQPSVPEKCGRYEGQIEPWKRFVMTSGIPDLRRTMQTKVADSVREQTRRDVADALRDVIEMLSRGLQAAEQQTSMSSDEMMRATRWSGELGRLADEVPRDPRYSHATAAGIEATLTDVVHSWGSLDRGGLEESHRHLAGMLANTGLHEATRQTTAVADLVAGELERRSREQPPPQAAGLPTPLEHWSDTVARFLEPGQTAASRDFRGPIFQGLRDDPSPVADGGRNLTGEQYLELMRKKAGRAARVYGSRLVHEIRDHLHRLQDRYRAVGSEVELLDQGQRERYAYYRAALERLRA